VLEGPVLPRPNQRLIGLRKRLERSGPNAQAFTLEVNLAIRPFCGAPKGVPPR